MSEILTGGCQCGAVRFGLQKPGKSTICHCRMCQKALGGLFGPFVSAPDAKWTRGKPKWFASSSVARRGFCENCGTPLAYETEHGLALTLGAFDRPDEVAPVIQTMLKDRLECYASLSSLPEAGEIPEKWRDFLAGIRSFQHPDHETQDWTPGGEKND